MLKSVIGLVLIFGVLACGHQPEASQVAQQSDTRAFTCTPTVTSGVKNVGFEGIYNVKNNKLGKLNATIDSKTFVVCETFAEGKVNNDTIAFSCPASASSGFATSLVADKVAASNQYNGEILLEDAVGTLPVGSVPVLCTLSAN